MPLVKSGRIVEDQYVRIADDAPMPDGVAVIVIGRALPRRRRGAHPARGSRRRAVAEQPADRRAGAVSRAHRAGGAGVPGLPRRARLQPGAHPARALWFWRRIARHRPGAARPVPVPAARRLRFLRGVEGGRCGGLRGQHPRASTCSTSRPATAAPRRSAGGSAGRCRARRRQRMSRKSGHRFSEKDMRRRKKFALTPCDTGARTGS